MTHTIFKGDLYPSISVSVLHVGKLKNLYTHLSHSGLSLPCWGGPKPKQECNINAVFSFSLSSCFCYFNVFFAVVVILVADVWWDMNCVDWRGRKCREKSESHELKMVDVFGMHQSTMHQRLPDVYAGDRDAMNSDLMN